MLPIVVARTEEREGFFEENGVSERARDVGEDGTAIGTYSEVVVGLGVGSVVGRELPTTGADTVFCYTTS